MYWYYKYFFSLLLNDQFTNRILTYLYVVMYKNIHNEKFYNGNIVIY